jgi:AraC-like DNA-binding protein
MAGVATITPVLRYSNAPNLIQNHHHMEDLPSFCLLNRRIFKAIKRPDRKEPVTHVALDLGYDCPRAFISMFKRALCRTLGQYFKQNLNNDT